MSLENQNKIKLFETALSIFDKGGMSNDSDRALIEKETRALLKASLTKKQATKAPPGFEEFLKKLHTFENPDDAYQMVLEFLGKDEKGLGEKGPGLGKDLGNPDIKPEIKPELGKDLDKSLDKKELLSDLGGLKPEPKPEMKDGLDGLGDLEDHKEHEMKESPKEELKEHKPDLKDEKGSGEKGPGLGKDLEKKEEPKGLGKGPMDKKLEKGKEDKLPFKTKDPRSAQRVQVRITSSRNLIAYLDSKPLFHAIVQSSIKEDVEALNRLANRVHGWIVYEGIETAAKKCGSRLLIAGIDDQIETNMDADLPKDSDPITVDGEDVIEEKVQEEPVKDSAEGAETVIASKEAGIEEGVEVVTEEKPPEKADSIVDKSDDVVKEEVQDAPAKDSRDEAETVIAAAEENFKQLYASRAKKLAKDANDKFVKKFIRAMKIAERRMALNYDANPIKAAAYDVLVEAGLDTDIASDLTEQIASFGQKEFLDHILNCTASLMEKSEDYLKDAESDLSGLNVKPVEVIASNSKSNKLKEEIEQGNFGLNANIGSNAAASEIVNFSEQSIRDAVSSTMVGERIKRASQKFGR